jgi:hypothetical protein
MAELEDFLKEQKAAEIQVNFEAATQEYTTALGKTYGITHVHQTDLIGLVTLGATSDLAVTENGATTLVSHTPAELSALLEEFRVYLTAKKTSRFNKLQSLEALTDHDAIQNFDTSI